VLPKLYILYPNSTQLRQKLKPSAKIIHINIYYVSAYFTSQTHPTNNEPLFLNFFHQSLI